MEWFKKTIQRGIYMYISENETLRFIDILHDVLRNYNTRKHAFLKASPLQVETNKTLQFETMILHSEKYANVRKKKTEFNVGNIVRISLKKSAFHRSYNIQRSYERFVIHSVNTVLKHPRYTLKDENSNLIKGHFLSYEFIKVDLVLYRAFIIKTRVRKNKKEFLHRFKGYSNSFDLWLTLDQSDPKYF